MEQFNLDTWLQDKSRKVVTRDGRPVRILCTDAKAKDGCCIIAAIETDGEEEGYQFFKDGKAYSSKSSIEDCADLFFADEEDGLTEFEKMLQYVLECYSGHVFASESEIETLKLNAKSLLDLARKEIEKDVYDNGYRMGYGIGKQDALKDLPEWKNVLNDKDFYLHEKLEDYFVKDTLHPNGCVKERWVLKKSDLDKLPKEE